MSGVPGCWGLAHPPVEEGAVDGDEVVESAVQLVLVLVLADARDGPPELFGGIIASLVAGEPGGLGVVGMHVDLNGPLQPQHREVEARIAVPGKDDRVLADQMTHSAPSEPVADAHLGM